MGNKTNIKDVVYMLNGEVIGDLQAVDVEVCSPEEEEVQVGDSVTMHNHEYTITMDNVDFCNDYGSKVLWRNRRYTIVFDRYALPRGIKLPKKKRIRKKWEKKYKQTIQLDNCVIQ